MRRVIRSLLPARCSNCMARPIPNRKQNSENALNSIAILRNASTDLSSIDADADGGRNCSKNVTRNSVSRFIASIPNSASPLRTSTASIRAKTGPSVAASVEATIYVPFPVECCRCCMVGSRCCRRLAKVLKQGHAGDECGKGGIDRHEADRVDPDRSKEGAGGKPDIRPGSEGCERADAVGRTLRGQHRTDGGEQ